MNPTTHLCPLDPDETYWCLDCGVAIRFHPPGRSERTDRAYCAAALEAANDRLVEP